MTLNKSTQTKLSAFLPLAGGLLIFGAMTLTLGEISEDIINHEPITVADVQLSNWLHAHTSPLLTKAMLLITAFGSTGVVTCIAVALGLFLLSRRQHYWLLALVLTVPGGGLLNKLLKYMFHRPRPHFEDPILKVTSYSFPSGHTMIATVLYGVIAAYVFTQTTDWRWRVLSIVSAALLIALVACSRIYLGAHYLSDVLGAMAEGLAWLSLCLTLVHSFQQRQSKNSD